MASLLDSKVIVVGAGPAGLATARELAVRGIDHVVLERGPRPGHVWSQLYDGLVLHTGKHLSALPGLKFPAATPLFPTRTDFVDYLARYADTFQLPIRTNTDVVSAHPGISGWMVRTADGQELHSRVLVVAAGIVSNPQEPKLPGREHFRGTIAHSVSYRRPDGYAGRRVLVVGSGNSAGEISVELARADAKVTVAVRSGARVVPRELLGVPIQYFAVALAAFPAAVQRVVDDLVTGISARLRGPAVLPRPQRHGCSNVPLIGFHLVDAIRAGSIRLKCGIAGFSTDGVIFSNGTEEPFDDVILATGYKATVSMLGDFAQVDGCGFARRRDRVTSLAQADLYFVGHNYDTRGALRNIAQDSQLAAAAIARQLA